MLLRGAHPPSHSAIATSLIIMLGCAAVVMLMTEDGAGSTVREADPLAGMNSWHHPAAHIQKLVEGSGGTAALLAKAEKTASDLKQELLGAKVAATKVVPSLAAEKAKADFVAKRAKLKQQLAAKKALIKAREGTSKTKTKALTAKIRAKAATEKAKQEAEVAKAEAIKKEAQKRAHIKKAELRLVQAQIKHVASLWQGISVKVAKAKQGVDDVKASITNDKTIAKLAAKKLVQDRKMLRQGIKQGARIRHKFKALSAKVSDVKPEAKKEGSGLQEALDKALHSARAAVQGYDHRLHKFKAAMGTVKGDALRPDVMMLAMKESSGIQVDDNSDSLLQSSLRTANQVENDLVEVEATNRAEEFTFKTADQIHPIQELNAINVAAEKLEMAYDSDDFM